MNSIENRLEQEYRKNLERCNRIIDKAEKEHDLDTMVSTLKEYQMWRENLTTLHDSEFEEWKKKMINDLIVKKCRSNDDCETCRMNH